MSRLAEPELIELIAGVLHRSGPALNPERIDIMQARLRANAIVQELRRRRLVVGKQEAAAPPMRSQPAA
jgi:hypothetical protein